MINNSQTRHPELKTLTPANPEEIAAEGVIDWALSLDMWHMEDICEYMTAYIAQPDQRILKEYFRGTFMAIVISGIVDILKEDSNGDDKPIAVLGPGKVLGEMGLIDGDPVRPPHAPVQKRRCWSLPKKCSTASQRTNHVWPLNCPLNSPRSVAALTEDEWPSHRPTPQA